MDMVRELDPEELAAFDRPDIEAAPELAARSQARKGRGAATNPAVRYDAITTEPVEDDWSVGLDTVSGLDALAELPPLPTTLIRDTTKSVISWNTSPDIGFDRAVNPYRGCEHGCVYCYARPTHAYLGYSPGLDFETKLLFKPEVAELLERELRKPGYVAKPLALGSNTDPYQPIERTLKLTRGVLEVLERCGHPVSIVTKSATVVRDLDILVRLAQRNLVRVWLSVTTLDPALARVMEPRASAPARRLQAVRALSAAGVPTGVLAAPMIPAVNDAELETIVEAASRAGAETAAYVLLRLPSELKGIFEAWLREHMPDRARKVLELIRQTRAGSLNDARFGQRFSGTGVYADLLASRFSRAARKWNLESRRELDCAQFKPPRGAVASRGFAEAQLTLF